ncbi:DUF4916 domain-containing protein [Alloscardovia theropitheci]|uniref:DUF4916 domain-containing protein n=1 Tax=Alloscardovia theropitheci TaxID=2496842 RepID=A0A4R0QW05_9BIFI|nr:DUF4916 domain-containing protein [Alloscardovia theropitheci]TCD54487.1 DUF4916 domain-containing protein [Alloscardovia theropitheci]
MPVLHDEIPDNDDFDAGRKRGEFDNITPDDFLRGTSSHNPPGWLTSREIDKLRAQSPIPYVVVLPVRTDEFGRIAYVGSLLTASDDDGTVSRTLITGRIVFHETIREAIARNISKDLGDMTLPHIPVNLQPFTVAEFFPTPGVSPYFDARQHAVALCYIVEIAGECQPMDETLDVEWVSPETALTQEFLGQLPNGFDRIMVQGLTAAGA